MRIYVECGKLLGDGRFCNGSIEVHDMGGSRVTTADVDRFLEAFFVQHAHIEESFETVVEVDDDEEIDPDELAKMTVDLDVTEEEEPWGQQPKLLPDSD
jgi:hypothetical protein